MPKIDRNSSVDAKLVTERILIDKISRKNVLSFLKRSVEYANKIDSTNWNLNLDKKGYFIQFNVGNEYCIQILKKKIHVVCIRKSLSQIIKGKKLDIEFIGWKKRKKYISKDMYSVPDSLSKVPDSVSCFISYENISKCLPFIEESNREFIEYAIINTSITNGMKNAHSIGYLAYLNEFDFLNQNFLLSELDYKRIQKKGQKFSKNIDDISLKRRAQRAKVLPQKIMVSVTKFIRNQYVVEYAKRQANGICQDCLQPAPFINKKTGEPFLETHHIKPLAEGGADTIENTIAICPNCHRKRHYE